MNLLVIGCNHLTAPIEVRERLAFGEAELPAALAELARRFGDCEFTLLSTCNRVELYTARQADDPLAPLAESLSTTLGELRGVPLPDYLGHLYEHHDLDTVRHLFRVASGLDSMVLGEAQILAQVKAAYHLAHELCTTGPLLNTLFQRALAVAKQVHTDTAVAQKRVSVSSVAVEVAGEIFAEFADKTVLVIGAGKMGEETLRNLHCLRPGRLLLTNRTFEKAQAMAARWHGEAVPFERLEESLVLADLVLSSTDAPEAIVTRRDFERLLPQRRGRLIYIIDLAVPRDFDPEIEKLPDVYLYSIDDLRRRADENRRQRERELPKAIAIVESHADAWLAELHRRQTGPVIARLNQWADAVTSDVEARLLAKLTDLPEAQQQEVRYALQLLQNKLLHPPLSALRDAALNGTHPGMLELLKRLFHIHD